MVFRGWGVYWGCLLATAPIAATPVGHAPPLPLRSSIAQPTWIELQPRPGEDDASAVAGNRLGQAVGRSGDLGVLSEDGEPVPLEALEEQTPDRVAAISDAGQAAGHVNVDGLPQAVLWENGTTTKLGTLPGHDRALVASIGNGGHVVGTSRDGRSQEGTGFLWRDGPMTELHPLPGHSSSNALFVNSSGTSVGESRDTGDDHTTYARGEDGDVSAIDPELIYELYLLNGTTDDGEVVFTENGGEEVFARSGTARNFNPRLSQSARNISPVHPSSPAPGRLSCGQRHLPVSSCTRSCDAPMDRPAPPTLPRALLLRSWRTTCGR